VKPSIKKAALFAAIAGVTALFFLEAITSWALMLRMRIANNQNFTKFEPTYFSLINIPYKAGVMFGFLGQPYHLDADRAVFEPDADLGYRPLPGIKYRVTYSRRTHGGSEWERLRVNYTSTHDGARWTGECQPTSTNVYIFGGSSVAGAGVNDEQTFAFLLQQARKDICVKLFAVGGYGITQAFIQFQKLRNQIRPNDIVILGYEDSLDVRTVVAPSRLREVRDWFKRQGSPEERAMLPKAGLDDRGVIHITHVQQHCGENDGYCNQTDPSRDEMSRITAALINEIARKSSAPVYLLHCDGSKQNPIFGFLSESVRRISALKEDFDYSIKDDIMGFDNHPGPYWHYAISRKLIDTLAIPPHASRP
jgi:hypothetical protein